MLKQVIVIRKDLNMRKGKMIAQGCHACLGAVMDTINDYNTVVLFRDWYNGAQTKIAVSVNSEQELTDLHDAVKAAGLKVSMITDHGMTEFHGVPTLTALAIGPAEHDAIDVFTGKLPLL
jgi:PTH2 family peptidyl-tRNA hydrolase